MEVTEKTKNAYKEASVHKQLTLQFPDLGLTIPHKQIYEESMKLKETLFSGTSIEFVGCISSSFEIQASGIKQDIKNKKITVSIMADGTDEDIPLFVGYVDSAEKQSGKNYKKITAYDELYTKGGIDVSAWYNALTFPVTLKDLRDSLFNYIGIEQVETELPNDSVSIKKQYAPNSLQSIAVIKAVCQINGAFGIMNRYGKFEYRIPGRLAETDYGCYPSPNTYLPFYPGDTGTVVADTEKESEFFSFYKTVDYQEYTVKPIEKVTVRQSEDSEGVTYGSGSNNYIIQGNMFTYGLSDEVLSGIAENVYNSVGGVEYRPFKSDNGGLPFAEVGVDTVAYRMFNYDSLEDETADTYVEHSFYILNRELSGIQNLRDSYSADGDEYQTEFITDLQTQIDTLKRNKQADVKEYVDNYTYSKDEVNQQIANTLSQFFLSVAELPENPEPNTVYAIQGEVVVN